MSKTTMSLMTLFSLTSFTNIIQVMSFAPMVRQTYLTSTTKLDVLPKSFLPFSELYHEESINHFSENANHLNEELKKNIVLSVSSGLPKFDCK